MCFVHADHLGSTVRMTDEDGRVLLHAVGEVQNGYGNPLFTCEYDTNGNMTAANGMSKITVRAKGTGVQDEPPEMELWLAGEKKMSRTHKHLSFLYLHFFEGFFSSL